MTSPVRRHLICSTPLLLGWLLVSVASAQVADAVRLFDEGNQHYNEGRYQEAITAYEQALDRGYTSGPLYYNMGNAYYRLDELGQAIRYYEKARRLMPDRPQLLHNLSIANTRTVDAFSQVPTPFWIRWWNGLVALIGPQGFFLAGLVLYLIAAGLISHRLWTHSRNPWYRRARTLSLIVGLLCLTAAFTASIDRTQHHRAVIVADETPLREAPQSNAPSELALHEGTVLDVLHQREGWTQIRLPNGTSGWLHTEALASI